jgi:hypothetical protein
MHTVAEIGTPVYVDAFLSGWVPGKVTGYTADGMVLVTASADRPGYKRGEQFSARPNAVTPRKHRYVKGGQYFVRGSWEFTGLAPEHQPRWADPSDA